MGTKRGTSDELENAFPVYAHKLGRNSQYGCVHLRTFTTGNIATVFEGSARFTASFLPSLHNSDTEVLHQLSISFCQLLFLTGSTRRAIRIANAKALRITENMIEHFSDNSSSLNCCFEFLIAANLAAFKLPSRSFTNISATDTNSVERPLFVFAAIPPDPLTRDSKTSQLVFLSKKFWDAEVYCRHLKSNSSRLESFSSLNSLTETSFGNFYDFGTKGTWVVAVYEQLITCDSQTILRTFLNSIDGQNNLSCERHKHLLIQKNELDTLTCFKVTRR